tara:strand:- start:284 stop:1972 length:1689 start_codon:yes stop_codon:yes gene_type:complete
MKHFAQNIAPSSLAIILSLSGGMANAEVEPILDRTKTYSYTIYGSDGLIHTFKTAYRINLAVDVFQTGRGSSWDHPFDDRQCHTEFSRSFNRYARQDDGGPGLQNSVNAELGFKYFYQFQDPFKVLEMEMKSLASLDGFLAMTGLKGMNCGRMRSVIDAEKALLEQRGNQFLEKAGNLHACEQQRDIFALWVSAGFDGDLVHPLMAYLDQPGNKIGCSLVMISQLEAIKDTLIEAGRILAELPDLPISFQGLIEGKSASASLVTELSSVFETMQEIDDPRLLAGEGFTEIVRIGTTAIMEGPLKYRVKRFNFEALHAKNEIARQEAEHPYPDILISRFPVRYLDNCNRPRPPRRPTPDDEINAMIFDLYYPLKDNFEELNKQIRTLVSYNAFAQDTDRHIRIGRLNDIIEALKENFDAVKMGDDPRPIVCQADETHPAWTMNAEAIANLSEEEARYYFWLRTIAPLILTFPDDRELYWDFKQDDVTLEDLGPNRDLGDMLDEPILPGGRNGPMEVILPSDRAVLERDFGAIARDLERSGIPGVDLGRAQGLIQEHFQSRAQP